MKKLKYLLLIAFAQFLWTKSAFSLVDLPEKNHSNVFISEQNIVSVDGIKIKSDRIIISAENYEAAERIARSNNLQIVDTYSHLSELNDNWMGLMAIKHEPRSSSSEKTRNLKSIVDNLKSRTEIQRVDFDTIVAIDATPNDQKYNLLWGLHNTGQNNGTADADIDAPETWDIFTGSQDVIVMVIDTGVDYNHPDIAPNMWKNPDEIVGNGIDDDGNGFIDDVYGIDATNNDSDPMDDHFHGTHCAGTIGAKGNNGVGVVGVNWDVKIMACKFLNANGSGPTSDAIKCMDYMTGMKKRGHNIVVSNNSWGGDGYVQSLYDAIEAAGKAGILFAAAAGNDRTDNDSNPHYPASYTSDYVLSVAATDRNDQLANFSNWGNTSVDLGAPGVAIHSTGLNSGYRDASGTSMATPHVAGVVGMLAALFPNDSPLDRKNRVLNYVDPIQSLSGRTVTGGRLNLLKSVQSAPFAVAQFKWSKLGELKRQFTDKSKTNQCNIIEWNWNFGDGQKSNERNPIHSYSSSAWYDVTLTVKGDVCGETSTTQAVWAGPNITPTANYNYSLQEGFVVNYTDQSIDPDGEITNWLWNFGDGQTSTEQYPSYKYPYTGTFDVSLTATDNEGASDTVTKQIEVPLRYCKSAAFSSSFMAISNVKLGSFSHSSGKSEYSDFTNQTIHVNSGNTYQLVITMDDDFWGSGSKARVWIDYDLDGFFNDNEEKVYEGSGLIQLMGPITIPITGVTKGHRMGMRISTDMGQSGTFPEKCDDWKAWGEVEDYAVVVH